MTGDRFRHGTKLLRFRPDKPPRQCSIDQIVAPPTRSLPAGVRGPYRRRALPSCATGPLAILRLACPPRRSIDLTGRIATIFGRELNVD